MLDAFTSTSTLRSSRCVATVADGANDDGTLLASAAIVVVHVSVTTGSAADELIAGFSDEVSVFDPEIESAGLVTELLLTDASVLATLAPASSS